MADNYLELHREQYEQRKQRYLSRKSHLSPELRAMLAELKEKKEIASS